MALEELSDISEILEIKKLLTLADDFLKLKHNLMELEKKKYIEKISDDELTDYFQRLLEFDPKKFTYAFHFLKSYRPLDTVIAKTIISPLNEGPQRPNVITKHLNQLTERFNAKKELLNDNNNNKQNDDKLDLLRIEILKEFNSFLRWQITDRSEINFYKTKALAGLTSEVKVEKCELNLTMPMKKRVNAISAKAKKDYKDRQYIVNIINKITDKVKQLKESFFYTNSALAKADTLENLAELIEAHQGNPESLLDLINRWENDNSNYINMNVKASQSPFLAGEKISNVELMQQQRGLFKWHKLSKQTGSMNLLSEIKGLIDKEWTELNFNQNFNQSMEKIAKSSQSKRR